MKYIDISEVVDCFCTMTKLEDAVADIIVSSGFKCFNKFIKHIDSDNIMPLDSDLLKIYEDNIMEIDSRLDELLELTYGHDNTHLLVKDYDMHDHNCLSMRNKVAVTKFLIRGIMIQFAYALSCDGYEKTFHKEDYC